MRYSLINVWVENNGYVNGFWMQDFTGTLSDAIKCAKALEKANSNRIEVAVTEAVNRAVPNCGELLFNLKRLG